MVNRNNNKRRRLFRKHHHRSSTTAKKWKGYFRCDDLVPPLCDDTLTVTQGQVETLRGVLVTYWRYTPRVLHDHKYPIIGINGGPGLGHNYMKPTRNLACDGREIVLYDQAGTGASRIKREYEDNVDIDDIVTRQYPELLTLDYYAKAELPAILNHLKWSQYHILAESWGTQIAFQFAAHYDHQQTPPKGLLSLLLNAPIADNHKFIEYQWDPVDGSVGTLPAYTVQQLLQFNETQDFDNEEFMELEDSVMDTFNARIGVTVDCWLETEAAGISSINYDRLTGVSDIFYPAADVDLKGWSVLPDLVKLQDRVPVQLNHGLYDMVRPRLIADTAAALGGNAVECHLLPRAAHSVLLDSPMEVYGYIRDFLFRVEEAHRHKQEFVTDGTSCFYSFNNHDEESLIAANTINMGMANNHNNNNNNNSNTTTGSSFTGMASTLIVCVVVAFVFGVRVGMKRNKKFTHGYEQLCHHHHDSDVGEAEQELEGHVL
jgi:L-proline amide hydrolase